MARKTLTPDFDQIFRVRGKSWNTNCYRLRLWEII